MSTILVTGGMGYIGSHTCVEIVGAGWEPVILDNLCNSSSRVLDRIGRIAGQRPRFVEGDVCDAAVVSRVLSEYRVDAVVHFAGLKAVGESVADPLRYYQNNVFGTTVLCEQMRRHGTATMVFSSSATVYGASEKAPFTEASRVEPINPYGRTKLIAENILRDLSVADDGWRTMLLRYFNPVGAHPSGLIGEDPQGVPANLMPYICHVAVGRQPHLRVFGRDYGTADGTAIRDYIHVVDLAKAHVAALARILEPGCPRVSILNLGTGRGHSVLEVVNAFQQATGVRIPCEFEGRRPGDVAVSYADVKAAREALGWTANLSLNAMCRDAWKWQKDNPQGV